MRMDITTILIIIIVGTVAGVLSGLLGVGGGIIIIPSLVIFAGMSQQMAQGTSLAMMLLPIGFLAVYNYYKADLIHIKYAAILAAVFVVGAYVGSKYAINMPQTTLKRIFGVLMLVVAIKMIFSK